MVEVAAVRRSDGPRRATPPSRTAAAPRRGRRNPAVDRARPPSRNGMTRARRRGDLGHGARRIPAGLPPPAGSDPAGASPQVARRRVGRSTTRDGARATPASSHRASTVVLSSRACQASGRAPRTGRPSTCWLRVNSAETTHARSSGSKAATASRTSAGGSSRTSCQARMPCMTVRPAPVPRTTAAASSSGSTSPIPRIPATSSSRSTPSSRSWPAVPAAATSTSMATRTGRPARTCRSRPTPWAAPVPTATRRAACAPSSRP